LLDWLATLSNCWDISYANGTALVPNREDCTAVKVAGMVTIRWTETISSQSLGVYDPWVQFTD